MERQDRPACRMFAVDEHQEGERLDRFLAASLPGCSRSFLAGLVGEKRVLVNQRPVKKNHRLLSGDRVQVMLPEPQPVDAQPEAIPLDVVYEDVDLLVVNKHSGMVVHPAPGSPDKTLVNAL